MSWFKCAEWEVEAALRSKPQGPENAQVPPFDTGLTPSLWHSGIVIRREAELHDLENSQPGYTVMNKKA